LVEPSIGGGPVSAINLANALLDRGHDVTLLLGTDPDKKIAEWIKGELTSNVVYTLGYSGITNLRSVLNRASKTLERLSPYQEVINAHGVSGLSVPDGTTDKLIVTIHGHVYSRGVHLFSSILSNRALWAFHSLIDSTKVMIGGALQGRHEKKVCNRARMVFTPSYFESRQIQQNYGIKKENVHRIPNIVSLPRATLEKRETDAEKTLLYVGGFTTMKGIPLLMKAVHQIFEGDDDARLEIAGDGPLRWIIQRLKRQYPERVRCHGVVSGEELSALYSDAGIFLFPSLYESYGLSIAEALYTGLPIVAYNTTAIPEMVLDGVNGLLAEPYDVSDIAEKTLELLSDPVRRSRMGRNAERTAKELTDMDQTIKLLENCYSEVA
jgi:glycosyltransferase involved in cell wall biosynthesis